MTETSREKSFYSHGSSPEVYPMTLPFKFFVSTAISGANSAAASALTNVRGTRLPTSDVIGDANPRARPVNQKRVFLVSSNLQPESLHRLKKRFLFAVKAIKVH